MAQRSTADSTFRNSSIWSCRWLVTRGTENERTSTKFLSYLVKVLEFPEAERANVRNIVSIIRHYAYHRGLSLRTIERIMTSVAVATAFVQEGVLRPPPIIAGLCILSVLNPELFAKAKEGTLTLDDIRDIFLSLPVHEGETFNRDHFVNWWLFCLQDEVAEEFAQQMGASLVRYGIERREIVPYVANGILERLTPT